MVSSITDFSEEELNFDEYKLDAYETYQRVRGGYRKLGMTSIQRFFMSLLLLTAVLAFGTIVLVYLQKMALNLEFTNLFSIANVLLQ